MPWYLQSMTLLLYPCPCHGRHLPVGPSGSKNCSVCLCDFLPVSVKLPFLFVQCVDHSHENKHSVVGALLQMDGAYSGRHNPHLLGTGFSNSHRPLTQALSYQHCCGCSHCCPQVHWQDTKSKGFASLGGILVL